jgi:hypothetical protein
MAWHKDFVTLSFYVPDEVRAQIDEIAASNHRSRAAQLQVIVDEWLSITAKGPTNKGHLRRSQRAVRS